MREIHKLQRYGIAAGILILVVSVFQPAGFTVQAQADLPVVHAVLFYSPACGHCHLVIQETLPPLIERYGSQLEIIGVDISQPQGQVFFEAAYRMFHLESAGVPFLVVGNDYLIGSVDIPQKFPTLIEFHLANGGIDWPEIPGLREAIHASQTAQAPTPTTVPPTSPAASPSTQMPDPVALKPDAPPGSTLALPEKVNLPPWQRIMLDPIGNGMAIVVLLMMIAMLFGVILTYRNIPVSPSPPSLQTVVPILCVLGLGVAGYLAYVETTQTNAVCGPVGDCNTVQQSEYARLFGILPIGVLGLIGYLAILASWAMAKTQTGQTADFFRLTAFALSAIGFVFSIYLTFLEPFVIGATCAWCVTSAIIMTALFVLTSRDVKTAILRIPSQ